MDGEVFSRIETLIPYREPTWHPTASLGKLDLASSPWAICAKLGRFLLSGGAGGPREPIARACLAGVFGGRDDEWRLVPAPYAGAGIDDLGAFVKGHAKNGPVSVYIREGDEAVYVVADDKMPGKYAGTSRWFRRSDPSRRVTLTGARLPVLLGALEICGSETVDLWSDPIPLSQLVCAEAGQFGNRKISAVADWYLRNTAFYELAGDRWGAEASRELNRRYFSGAHTATVFEDKKDRDREHLALAAHGFIAESFGKVEVDNEVDVGAYRDLEREFEARYASGELPQVDTSHMALRFRKCGRHRATGLYSPVLDAIAVDPRHPSSTLHEFAHAFDFQHGQLSSREGFRPILRSFEAGFRREGLSDAEAGYALTPTEVFARAWEVYASSTGMGGSFVKPAETYLSSPIYSPLAEEYLAVGRYFNDLLGAERPVADLREARPSPAPAIQSSDPPPCVASWSVVRPAPARPRDPASIAAAASLAAARSARQAPGGPVQGRLF